MVKKVLKNYICGSQSGVYSRAGVFNLFSGVSRNKISDCHCATNSCYARA